MKREEMVMMAKEAGICMGNSILLPAPNGQVEALERFAALVAAREREACAAIAEMPKYLNETGILTVNPAKSAAAHFIAIAIRARGEPPR